MCIKFILFFTNIIISNSSSYSQKFRFYLNHRARNTKIMLRNVETRGWKHNTTRKIIVSPTLCPLLRGLCLLFLQDSRLFLLVTDSVASFSIRFLTTCAMTINLGETSFLVFGTMFSPNISGALYLAALMLGEPYLVVNVSNSCPCHSWTWWIVFVFRENVFRKLF